MADTFDKMVDTPYGEAKMFRSDDKELGFDAEYIGYVYGLHTQNPPTDVIKYDDGELTELPNKFIVADKNGKRGMSSDIFYADTIPLPNCTVSLKVPNVSDITLDAHFMADKDAIGTLSTNRGKKDTRVIHGFLCFVNGNKHVMDGWKCDVFSVIVGKNGEVCVATEDRDDGYRTSVMTLSLTLGWYCAQILILNSDIKNVFGKPKKETLYTNMDKNGKPSKTLRKVGTFRTHTVTLDGVERKLTETYGVNRKCLAWYVRGHWRTRNGIERFVHGYWKGPMRNVKNVIDSENGTRERVLSA